MGVWGSGRLDGVVAVVQGVFGGSAITVQMVLWAVQALSKQKSHESKHKVCKPHVRIHTSPL